MNSAEHCTACQGGGLVPLRDAHALGTRTAAYLCSAPCARQRPCPLRARWVSQTRGLTVTHGQAEMPHDLSTGTRPWVWSNGSPQLRSMICARICAQDAVGRVRHGRRPTPSRTSRTRPPRSTGRPETARDARRMAHNPEVAGSNPAPATSLRSSRPFPDRERAFGVPGTVVKRVPRTGFARSGSETGWHGMRQPGRSGRRCL